MLAVALAAAAFAADCAADQVALKNGDRLTGSVISSDVKSLVFKSEYAGVVTVPWEAVIGLDSTSDVYVGLKGGQLIAGPISLSAEKGADADRGRRHRLRGARRNRVYPVERRAEGPRDLIERYRNPRLVDLWTGYVDLGFRGARQRPHIHRQHRSQRQLARPSG